MALKPDVLIHDLVRTPPPILVGSREATQYDPLLGVELEIERARNIRAIPNKMFTEDDGSLRHNGVEFITMPLAASELKEVLTEFFKHNADEISPINYSDRCSIHVHMNVSPLTITQLCNLAKLYLLYEQHLFNFAGEERDNNIFCTPLSENNRFNDFLLKMPSISGGAVCDLFNQWVKYTALNFRPIGTQGTIEFRHMPGTYDVAKIHDWIDLLVCLHNSAREMTEDMINTAIRLLNSNSQYHVFTRSVFRDKSELITQQPDFVDDIYKGIMVCKRGML